MCFHFYYEDGQGKIVDEQGNDAMDWEDDVTQFHLTTLTRIRQYCKIQEGEEEIANTVKLQRNAYTKYSNELKPLFVHMDRIKLFNDAKSGRLADGIAKRTAQKWTKRLKKDKDWNILEKQTNLVNRPKLQLGPEHKTHLVNLFDDNPQARLTDAVDSLTHNFADLSIKKSTLHNFVKTECNLSFKKVTLQPITRNNSTKIDNRLAWIKQWTATDMNHLENCVFVDEPAFNINMRPSGGWAEKGKPAIITTLFEGSIPYDFGRHFF